MFRYVAGDEQPSCYDQDEAEKRLDHPRVCDWAVYCLAVYVYVLRGLETAFCMFSVHGLNSCACIAGNISLYSTTCTEQRQFDIPIH